MYQNLLPLWRTNEELMITAWEGLGFTNNYNLRRNTYVKGSRHYELSNHTSTLLSAGLGNVLAVVSDRKIEHDERYAFAQGGGYKYENGAYHLDASGSFAQLSAADGIISSYSAEVISATDYYAFGAPMPERSWQGGEYRFGFNSKDKDDETYGTGNAYDFGARIYDSRLNRWMSLDPLQGKYPGLSAYNYVANSPLIFIDPNGEDIVYFDFNGKEIYRITCEEVMTLVQETTPVPKDWRPSNGGHKVPSPILIEGENYFVEVPMPGKITKNLDKGENPNSSKYNKYDYNISAITYIFNRKIKSGGTDLPLGKGYVIGKEATLLDVNLVKALAYKESRLGQGSQVSTNPSDILSMLHPGDFLDKSAIGMTTNDLNIKGLSASEIASRSLEFGIKWLYYKSFLADKNYVKNFKSWEFGIHRYGPGKKEPNYKEVVFEIYNTIN